MITNKEAEEILKHEYHLENFIYLIDDILLPDFVSAKHDVHFNNEIFQTVKQIGESSACNITIFEVRLNEGAQTKRVTITQEMFKILRSLRIDNAIVSFVNADEKNYRISLLTSRYEYEGDKIVRILSNPRRFSYSLGFGTKTKTAFKYLIAKGKVKNLDELIERFSVEVVNKQFYSEVSLCFTKLIGGERDGRPYVRQLGLYGVQDAKKYAEFAVRLIGRITFCWFLKEKKSENGVPLIPEAFLTTASIQKENNYYHNILEPLFFELLNTNQKKRKDKYKENEYNQIPYLNGGLFSPHTDDLYKYDAVMQCGKYGLVNIPNEWFTDFFNVLSQYNFTVDENTSYDIELSIDPEMLGRIFENLLAEINPETGENAKKSTGSFYTPRDIVDYMVDSSLCEYLVSKTQLDKAKLKALISYGKEDDSIAIFTTEEKKKIINALYSITILDPACGSGAFPIGMLQKIVYVLQEIDPSADLWFDKATENVSYLLKKEFEKKFNDGSLNYIRKLSVIQNSIFGIDIQPIAVEISRLRCFLSLVIEEKVKDEEYNRGINPLPNLDFKFIIANSLLKLDNNMQINVEFGKQIQTSMFEDEEHIDRLKTVRDEYFNAESERRSELKLEFKNIQQDMLLNTIANYQKQATARYQQLSSWKPFENEPTNWFDPDWMFGIKNGFDIVIGNPPYVQLQKMHKDADILSKMGYRTFTRTGDLYCIFYEFGYNVLKTGGILTYITSNKWMRASYGENLRKFFTTATNPILLVDFCGQKVFETATVDVNILMLKKEKNMLSTQCCIIKDDCRNNLSNYIDLNCSVMKFNDLGENWTILNPIEYSIKAKIERIGKPISEWNLNINRGILTGYNDAFIIDEITKNKLIEEDPKSAEIIRPILRGKDIKKYGYDFKNLYLINTHNGNKSISMPRINIEDYPAIKKHLDKFINELKNRYDKGDTPYNLRNCNYMDDFFKQKIVYPCIMSQGPCFALDESQYFTLAPGNIISGKHLKYLCCALNSDVIYFALRKFYMGGGIEGELKTNRLLILPIKFPTETEEQDVNSLYKYHEQKTNLINEYFYKMYRLDKEEIEYIKNYKTD